MSNPLVTIVPPGTTTTSAVATTTTTTAAPTTTTTTTSSAPSTTTTSSATNTSSASSSSSAASSSTTTSSAPVVTNTSTTASPTTSNSLVLSTGAGGQVFTSTSVVFTTPSSSAAAVGGSNKTFFQNTAAVAATFSVAGLVALGILFICVTNGLRRRRAKRFDDDVAEAAAVAANAHAPVFDDEVYHTSTGAYSGYSDHGGYNQPPMSHYTGDSYGMSEIQPYNMYAGDAALVGGGAAGVGVGAAVQRARSRREIGDLPPAAMAGYDNHYNPGYGEHASPYPAFAAPPVQGGYRGPPNNTEDLLAAAGMAGMGGTAAAGNIDRRQSNNRNRYSGSHQQNYGPAPGQGAPYRQNSLAPPAEYDDPYGGYDDSAPSAPAPGPAHGHVSYPAVVSPAMLNPHSPQLVNPHSPAVQSFSAQQEHLSSPEEEDGSKYSDEESEEEHGGRVLKVANE